jgi:hypothetical protein
MMNWLWGAALAPLLFCGLMCGVPMLLAVIGVRRRNERREAAPMTDAAPGWDQDPSATP